MELTLEQIAAAMSAEIVAEGEGGSPARAAIDSGEVSAGDLFFGLRGGRVDGGEFAADAIGAAAWGVVVGHARAEGLGGAWVFAVDDPLAALQALARAWRLELGARVVGITGSVGKTSVKDIVPCTSTFLKRLEREPSVPERGRVSRKLAPQGCESA